MQLCEMGSLIQGHWFREVHKLSESGHQTSIITTHPKLEIQHIAGKMFARWGQEFFFKYLSENFDFDRMHTIITQNVKLTEKIAEYTANINDLLSKRKNIPARITVRDLPDEKQYNKLIEESKKLKNLILKIAYRAESALYSLLPEVYMNANKDGRQLLKEIFTTCADLIPDYQNQILYVRLHSLATPRANAVAKFLCEFLNETNSTFPMTDLKLIYEMIAP